MSTCRACRAWLAKSVKTPSTPSSKNRAYSSSALPMYISGSLETSETAALSRTCQTMVQSDDGSPVLKVYGCTASPCLCATSITGDRSSGAAGFGRMSFFHGPIPLAYSATSWKNSSSLSTLDPRQCQLHTPERHRLIPLLGVFVGVNLVSLSGIFLRNLLQLPWKWEELIDLSHQ